MQSKQDIQVASAMTETGLFKHNFIQVQPRLFSSPGNWDVSQWL